MLRQFGASFNETFNETEIALSHAPCTMHQPLLPLASPWHNIPN
jgi:hypothetical protein